MFMRSIFLLLAVAGLASCSGKQKRICQQNVAYQHGYQAAQKGESLDNASTDRGGVCQDFEAYSPTMYRSDFKAGYFKGKGEYCSEYNYKRWGQEDGEMGKIEYPNSYSVDMKICLQDDEYKKLAEKTYQTSFNEAFCSENRLQELGISQAKAFEPLKVPNVKKRCGNKLAGAMESAMRTSYKEQMKTNCTASFWLIKGEEDAVKKKSKATELAKVQKCPASARDGLMAGYSKAYNERKALLIEEEKLALERQRQKDQMELERQRQQQEYELAKERNEIVRDAVLGGGTNYRPHIFYHTGHKLSIRCVLDDSRHQAQIFVKNLGNRHHSFSGKWKITYYDAGNRLLKTNTEYEHLSLSSYEEEDFYDRFAPWEARRCAARFYK